MDLKMGITTHPKMARSVVIPVGRAQNGGDNKVISQKTHQQACPKTPKTTKKKK